MISIGYDADGRRIRRKVSGKTKAIVQDRLKALHSDVETAAPSALPLCSAAGAAPGPGPAPDAAAMAVIGSYLARNASVPLTVWRAIERRRELHGKPVQRDRQP